MDELIARITSNVGIDAATAQKAVGMILAFLQKEGPADKVQQLLAAFPGAEEAISQVKGGGLLSGLMGGVMGLGTQLMGAGLGMGEISGVAKETIRFAKEKAGDEPVDAVVGSIPGLGQFV
ncbi:DUF2267 domain-containing protein [Brucella pituitosa]|jgi:hypothetical protein|uniref:DUF2267 domain-containing protein n=1 Tax=Brucella pituitosa TaxID=571256 RepID=A0A643F6Z1_9HYPH|nr:MULTISPECIES: hypothetical protein [Brucella]PQZ49527.1 hypothetical protein CQZ90_13530 [Ochrobactrum sp. MYb19]PRA57251.1 hypothetical protein CQ062_00365 [Ochrobactrum sp. MYb68]PRA66655.1 hypothetical protein CQ053_04790 [Ochrobactrum sp. MYb18]PRA76315.1 hypothetical protein CQ049_02655 [Brucella thiophenivorans]PRA89332.1 hypothetical protein CQ054_04205 [Ochrobactrum sp. MYb29]PRA91665.1 hypothetical protein CQ051_05805 [Ochrobactrum sp. MYb14]PRA98322.1 hypothetical protein CQ052_